MQRWLPHTRCLAHTWNAVSFLFPLAVFAVIIGQCGVAYADVVSTQASSRGPLEPVDAAALLYESDFPGVVRSIVGRQSDASATELNNNKPGSGTISPGQTQYWKFPADELHKPISDEEPLLPAFGRQEDDADAPPDYGELKRRDDEPWLHVTLSTCSQPLPASARAGQPPPPLNLLVSWKNPKPGTGPSADTSVVPLNEGYARYDNQMSSDLFIAIQAPSAGGYSGSYTYELAGSIDTPFAEYKDYPFHHAIDTDSGAGLFITSNLTDENDTPKIQEWLKLGPRFSIFVHNANDTQFSGIRRSFCGVKRNALLWGGFDAANSLTNLNVTSGMTTVGGGAAKQQFLAQGLNKTTTYSVILGLETNYSATGAGHPTGGGTLWRSINVTTKAEDSCRLISNLSFCDRVGYAVPGNPRFSRYDLGQRYDDYARSLYTNFSYSMEQIPCDAPSDAKYSLAVDCGNCTRAYKDWLCAVIMPRCADFSSKAPSLQVRNNAQNFINGTDVSSIDGDPNFSAVNRHVAAMNQSRNPWIDSTIQPGPYKELLPCGSLCYRLVQSCPSVLGFACPQVGKWYNQSYGTAPYCNIPGSIWGVSIAPLSTPSLPITISSIALVLLWQSLF